ncbi:hypothetical protein LTR37_013232 [Vermiconidia calcicola]|uniref:Uncharacterized protein n=1 Tax=Vermiconidia calcicola TaxID=1690605 RepID=A0ACC3MX63_9PEZI|nr:hypothetical protein LTR37_013232 [Vermiconidia calcicola]
MGSQREEGAEPVGMQAEAASYLDIVEQARGAREASNAKTHLLSLSMELQDYIYKLSDPRKPPGEVNIGFIGQASSFWLLHTCRVIRNAATPIVYGSNGFRLWVDSISSCETSLHFMTCIPDEAVSCLREVVIRGGARVFGDVEARIHFNPFSISQVTVRQLAEQTELSKENEATRRADILFLLQELKKRIRPLRMAY